MLVCDALSPDLCKRMPAYLTQRCTWSAQVVCPGPPVPDLTQRCTWSAQVMCPGRPVPDTALHVECTGRVPRLSPENAGGPLPLTTVVRGPHMVGSSSPEPFPCAWMFRLFPVFYLGNKAAPTNIHFGYENADFPSYVSLSTLKFFYCVSLMSRRSHLFPRISFPLFDVNIK